MIMRLIVKVKKILQNKITVKPVGIFPEDTGFMKRLKNKEIEIKEYEKDIKKDDLLILDESKTQEIIFKNLKKKKGIHFSPKRGKFYACIENEYMKILIDPLKSGRIDYLFHKENNFEWFFDDYIFFKGKVSHCGITQGIKGEEFYEKKMNFNTNKNKFVAKRKDRKFIFEKIISLEGKKINVYFKISAIKDIEINPFFDLKVFCGNEKLFYEIYVYRGNKITLPNPYYPFSRWHHNFNFGKVNCFLISKEKNKMKIIPGKKDLLNSSVVHAIDYILFRFRYKKLKLNKNKKREYKMEILL